MSWLGETIGLPLAGDKTLLVANIKTFASACASAESGTCTAIWSPSKSALNASQTSGWTWIAFPSTRIGSNAWIPNLCKVGALFNKTGCSSITSAKTSQTCALDLSTILFADFIFWAKPSSTNLFITKGLNNSNAIIFGRPHWFKSKCGPTTITDLAE